MSNQRSAVFVASDWTASSLSMSARYTSNSENAPTITTPRDPDSSWLNMQLCPAPSNRRSSGEGLRFRRLAVCQPTVKRPETRFLLGKPLGLDCGTTLVPLTAGTVHQRTECNVLARNRSIKEKDSLYSAARQEPSLWNAVIAPTTEGVFAPRSFSKTTSLSVTANVFTPEGRYSAG